MTRIGDVIACYSIDSNGNITDGTTGGLPGSIYMNTNSLLTHVFEQQQNILKEMRVLKDRLRDVDEYNAKDQNKKT